MRLLGIDFGQRRVGLALATDDGRVAEPHATLPVRGRDHAIDRLVAVIAELAVDEVVMGLPLDADGAEGAMARRLRRISAVIARRSGCPVHLVDEHLTSAEAATRLRDAGSDRPLDEVAAALILQRYLDGTDAGHGDGSAGCA